MKLTITRTFAVAELGTIAFVGDEPVALVLGARHRVALSSPDGRMLEADASVECLRNDASGEEFTALLFASLTTRDVLPGSTVRVLGRIQEP